MNVLLSILNFLVNEILSVPAFLIGIITAVGLAALGRSAGQVLGSAIKATLGFLLIGAGAGLVVASLGPLGAMITGATGAQGVVPTNEAIVGIAQKQFGSQVAWIMILGFVVSLLLARFTPMSYVFLTGHHVLFMATLLTMVLAPAGYPSWFVVLFGAALLGILMVAQPAIAQPWTRRITGDDSIAIGHFGTAGYVTAGAVGKLVGGKGRKMSPSTEDLKLPEGLRFLRDSMVATALSMALMYLVLALLFLGRRGADEAFQAFEGGATNVGNYLMQSITQGLQFGVAVAVILFGVRTILGEIVPAFQGIAAKVVPGAVPALDCPIFFTGGAAGVYGNATGGRRGAVLGAFANGLVITFLPAFLLTVLGSFGSANTTFGDADFGWFGLLLGWSVRPGGVAGIVLMTILGLAILGLGWFVQTRLVAKGWDPSPQRPKPSAAGAAASIGTSDDSVVSDDDSAPAAGITAASRKYPRVLPPAGAPVPPARVE